VSPWARLIPGNHESRRLMLQAGLATGGDGILAHPCMFSIDNHDGNIQRCTLSTNDWVHE
jgi:hypothetical protein